MSAHNHDHEHADGEGEAKKDCGCGCGGSGGCAEPEAREPSLFPVRRKFLTGAIGLSGFAATLAARRALAAATPCNNLTGMIISPAPSTSCVQQSLGGLTPGFWMNHLNCWPAGVAPGMSFAAFGLCVFPCSTETLGMALCPPNGGDNLAFQCAAALCNSGTPALQQAYGYVGIAAFVSSFNAAAKASNNNWGLIHMILSGMNQDNPNQAAFCGGKPTKVDCSQYPNNCSG